VSSCWRICVALLLALPALAQQIAIPPASEQPAGQSAPKPDSEITEIRVECVPASRASELIDKHGCVAGKVFRVTIPKSGSTRISLCHPRSSCSFQAVVLQRDQDKLGDLSYLHGKLVAFVGDITSYRGHPEIVVKSIRQVHVAADAPPTEFDAAQAKPLRNGQLKPSKQSRAW
jgi:hypothetical protein